MTINTGPNLGAMVDGLAGELHYNEFVKFLRVVDGLVQSHVIDKDLAAPPATPANGAMYIVAASPTGAWAGQATRLARYYTAQSSGPAWEFFTPRKGWRVHVEDEGVDYQYNGSTWVQASAAFVGGTLSQALNEAPIVTLASAATVDIGAATANTISISGTTTITSLGTIAAGAKRALVFQDALTLTHNATSLILPGGADIVTAAGDVLQFVSLGSGNWRCVAFQRGAGFDSMRLMTRASVVLAGGNPLLGLINPSLSIPDYSGIGISPALEAGELGRWGSNGATAGGVAFNGWTGSSNPAAAPLSFIGYHGHTSPTVAACLFYGFKHSGTNNRVPLANGEIVAQFNNGSTARLQCLGDGTWRPAADNAQPLGGASNRWSVVYAGTGTINTSDAREKTEVRPLTAAELAAAKGLAREVGAYRWLSAISEKGDAAREHIGLTVQRAIEVMQSHGLDPMNYGFVCFDTWDDRFVEHPADYEQVEVRDDAGKLVGYEQGELIAEAWTEQVQVAGDRYSFRPDELMMFLARGFEARLSALEEAMGN